MASIGVCANVYNEAHAIGGFLESALKWADDVRIFHAGPQGAYSNDGTIEIIEKWKVPITFGSIDEGFGIVRTAAIRFSPCEWVCVLDADERIERFAPLLTCHGQSTPPDEANAILQSYDFRDLKTMIPNWENVKRLGANLSVSVDGAYDQIAFLRNIIETEPVDAVITVRRHWHDFTWKRPTQNWHTDPDWQMQCVRNVDYIHYNANTRMHEQLMGVRNPWRPRDAMGPFFDHFHFSFKAMAMENRAHAVKIYDKIHAGEKPPTWEEFKGSQS